MLDQLPHLTPPQKTVLDLALARLNTWAPKIALLHGLMLFAPETGWSETRWRIYREDTTANPLFGYFRFNPNRLWHSYDVSAFGAEELNGGLTMEFLEKHTRRAFEDLKQEFYTRDCETFLELLKLLYVPGQMVFNEVEFDKKLTRFSGDEDEGGLTLHVSGAFLFPRAEVPTYTAWQEEEAESASPAPYLILPFEIEY
jgi:hypothetical protein